MARKRPERKFETPKILHDWPLKKDQTAYFNFDDFAVTLARLIASKETATPLTIGVSGHWGSGKTTLLRRIEAMLNQTTALYDTTKPVVLDFCGSDESPQALFRPCRTVWFNAWKYIDEDQLLVALIRVIVQAMFADDFISKGAAALFEPFTPRRDVIETVLSWFSIKTPFGDVKPGTGEAKQTPFAEKTAMLDLFDDGFNKLLAAWVQRSLNAKKLEPEKGVLVVFIDDLDRCLPPKMVQVLEAVKLFLDKECCVFVLGADKDIVQQAIEKQYETAGIKGQSAADYLEKIMQLRFELPVSTHADMQTLLDGEKIIGADWGDSWRLLITGAEINPRRVKTFVNDLNLQWAMLVNAGHAKDVNRADFNAYQVLMRVAPANFVQQVRERLEDVDLRCNFVLDAIKWARGDETLKATFQDYDSWRLRRVLRDIAFSVEFNPQVLDAFVHLVAPPEKLKPEPVQVEAPASSEMKVEAGKYEVAGTPVELQVKELQPGLGEAVLDFGIPAQPELAEAVKSVSRGGAKPGERNIISPSTSREGAIVIGGMEFMPVPKGKFVMGSKEDDKEAFDQEKPQHSLEIPYDYWLARYTVTNEQYSLFVKAVNAKHLVSGWEKKKDHPVVSVSWNEAQAFVQWLNESQAAGLPQDCLYRLPTEAEWEKAARGAYGNIYPWGNEFDVKRCNVDESKKGGTVPVDAYPTGVSPYGCEQMAGNVWEWTHSLFEKYPYKAEDGREVKQKSGDRVLRGGAFDVARRLIRCASRGGLIPGVRGDDGGFRVCVAPISNL